MSNDSALRFRFSGTQHESIVVKPRMRWMIIAFLAAIGFAHAASAATETVIYSFTGAPHGANPLAGLIAGKGALYGTTAIGGKYNSGTVFSIEPKTGAVKVLHSFGNGSDGNGPVAALLDVRNTLYGTTVIGGAFGFGTVFSVDRTTGAEKVLYSLCAQPNCADGRSPVAGLIALNGKLYGTTPNGGNAGRCYVEGCGTIFSVDPNSGAETTVYTFCALPNCVDGALPYAGLLDVNGILYGVTNEGGTGGGGTVFAIDPKTGVETVIHSFKNDGKDGLFPQVGLLRVDDRLYGTTSQGGTSTNCDDGCGTVFSIRLKTGAETVLYSFSYEQGGGGADPDSTLIYARGLLYGTTTSSAYSLDPLTDIFTELYVFCSKNQCIDGGSPYGSLLDLNGTLYGTTFDGGTGTNCGDGCGTVYKINP